MFNNKYQSKYSYKIPRKHRRFDVHATSITLKRRCMDVKTCLAYSYKNTYMYLLTKSKKYIKLVKPNEYTDLNQMSDNN